VLEAGKDPEKEQVLVERMRSLLQPFVLRRLKNELKDQLVDKAHVMHEVRTRACMHACCV
jgi:SNF2 family DNA or RNA helicase